MAAATARAEEEPRERDVLRAGAVAAPASAGGVPGDASPGDSGLAPWSPRKRLLVAAAALLAAASGRNAAPYLRGAPSAPPRQARRRPARTAARRPPVAGTIAPRRGANRTTSRSAEAFRVENLRLGGRICCGYFKCFFRLQRRPDVAYVAVTADSPTMRTKKLRSMSEAWRLGERLERDHSQLQLMLGPPEVVLLEEEARDRLNANLYNCHADKPVPPRYLNETAIVQKTRPAPTPSALFGCASKTRRHFYRTWGSDLLARVDDVGAFRRDFARHLDAATDLLAAVPGLALDFQFFVDAAGRLHHFDLDRAFQNTVREEDLRRTRECVEELRERLRRPLPGEVQSESREAGAAATPVPGRVAAPSHGRSENATKSSAEDPDDDNESFRLENLNLEGGRHCCTLVKCFFPLKQRPDVSYVVIQTASNGTESQETPDAPQKWLAPLTEAWRLGQELERHHSQRQLTLASPEVVELAQGLADRLNANLYDCEGRGEKLTRPRYRRGAAIVQKVRTRPAPAAVFGCRRAARRAFYRTWERELLSRARDREGFRANLTEDVAAVARAMTSVPALRCLATGEFRVLVDTLGRVHHLDVERCHGRGASDWQLNKTVECLGGLTRAIAHSSIEERTRQ